MDILAWIMNPWILLIILVPLVGIIFLLAGIYLSQPRKTHVQQFSPESGSGKIYEVKHEDSIYMECPPLGDEFPQRFVKSGQAYNMLRKTAFKLQNFAMWIGRIGTAYTYALDTPDTKLSLEATLITLFSRETYNKLSGDLKRKIAEAKIGVTIRFPQVTLSPTNPNYNPEEPTSETNLKYMPLINSDDVRRGAFDKFINALARGIHDLSKAGSKQNVTLILLAMGSGGAIAMLTLLAFGRIK